MAPVPWSVVVLQFTGIDLEHSYSHVRHTPLARRNVISGIYYTLRREIVLLGRSPHCRPIPHVAMHICMYDHQNSLGGPIKG